MFHRIARFFRRAKTDILIGAMAVLLYALIGFIFYYCMYRTNAYLRHANRTAGTIILTFVVSTVAMRAVYGGYDVGQKKDKPVISAMIFSTLITDIITYIQFEIMNTNINNRQYLDLFFRNLFSSDLLYLLICYIVQVLVIILFVRLGNQLYFHFTPPQSVLLILGDQDQEESLRAKIGQYKLQWRVDDAAMFYAPDIKERIDRADIIFLGNVPFGAKFTLLKLCYDDRKDVMCKAEMEEIMLCNSRPAIIDDAAFLSMKYSKITLLQRIIKRLGDVVISLLALILFSPLILIVSLLIKLEDGGPVIFKQDRLTLNGRTFTIRKFRTMAPHDESEDDPEVSVAQDDPRITKVGSFLRRFRLDEIPQFVNILIGDMSLVGPRPEMMANVTRYKMDLPAFVYREKMKAGLTGYAQIEGRYNTTAEDKLMLDLMYIESFSIWVDVKLILRTFTLLFKKDSTQGFRTSPGSNNIDNQNEGDR